MNQRKPEEKNRCNYGCRALLGCLPNLFKFPKHNFFVFFFYKDGKERKEDVVKRDTGQLYDHVYVSIHGV